MQKSTSITDQKAALRKAALAKRDALSVQQRIEGSLTVVDQVQELSVLGQDFLPGTIVSGFLPIRSEIDTRPLMAALTLRGARLCLPVVIDKTTIEFREMIRGAPLVECGFGTVGPNADALVLDPQIVLVPLSVFDRKGGRIGYGAGHYDRAVARLIAKGKAPKLVGVAFSVQEADGEVPTEAHDQLLSAIITERELITIPG